MIFQSTPIVVDKQTISIVLTVIGMITGVAVMYLRLFVTKELATLKEQILKGVKDDVNEIRAQFISKELMDAKFQLIDTRMKSLEGKSVNKKGEE